MSALLTALLGAVSHADDAPTLEVVAVGVTDGHGTLHWDAGGSDGDAANLEFELETSEREDFAAATNCYTGPDRASFRSGLTAGTHWFRVRQRAADAAVEAGGDAAWSAWSTPVSIEIRPYSLPVAWTIFGVGACLMAAIVGYLVRASARSGGVA